MSGPYDFNAQLLQALGPAPQAAPAPAAPAPLSPWDFNGQLAQQIAPTSFDKQLMSTLGGPSQVEHPELTINNAGLAGGFSVTPPAAPGPAPAPAPAAQPQVAATTAPQQPQAASPVAEGGFPLHLAGGGGVIPAHEVEKRGPTLLRAQNRANEMQAQAIQDVARRTEETAAVEQQMYLDQSRQAIARQNAIEQAQAERQQDLEDRANDFQSTVKQLSSMSMDPDRFWASRNTGQKIAGMIGIALGGFLQGARGGSNPGLDIINQAIDRDIDAQKFAYQATKDTAAAKQTAYSMAMQKYQSPEAATAAARAAALDSVQAQLGQMAAQYKGTTAGSQAEMMGVELARLQENQAGQGIAFIQPQSVGRVWYDRYGIPYTDAQAREYAARLENQNFELGKQELGQQGTIANTVVGKVLEGANEQSKAQRGMAVQLPNGDVVTARSADHAKQLSDASASVHETRQLVSDAKKLRDDPTFRIPGSQANARLKQIQSELITQYGVQNRLGALSASDMELAKKGTSELFNLGPGVDAALDGVNKNADTKLRALVRTIPEAPGTAKGEMPSSFTPHGK